jgi:hypothetical protein
MEPESPAPRPSQEMGPVTKGGENAPSFSGGEQMPRPSVEQTPRTETRETLPAPAGGGAPAFVAPQPPVAPAVSVQPISSSTSASQPVGDNPISAADEDLIEKEWVDRAKKIIAHTKNDPYLQEKEVSRLQADYLKKRYGKEIKLPTE